MRTIVGLRNIDFSYNHRDHILKSFTMDFNAGEIVAIIGNSGCGKSTLLNIIAGLLLPQKGIVDKRTDSISYLMQKTTLLPHLTVEENSLLAYKLLNKKLNQTNIQNAQDLLYRFRLSDKDLHKFPEELSGGMKQRVGLVQSLLTDVSLYLYDEPFNAIDVSTLEIIKEYIWNYFRNTEKTLIFITHNIDQALQLSDHVIVIKDNETYTKLSFNTEFRETTPLYRNRLDAYNKYFLSIIERM